MPLSGGLRHAAVLLKYPVSNLGWTLTTSDQETVTKHMIADYPSVANDLGITAPHDVTIKMTEQSDGKYDVESSYSF